MEIFFGQKKCGSTFFLAKKKLGQKNLGHKKFGSKIIKVTKNVGKKICWPQKNLVHIFLGMDHLPCIPKISFLDHLEGFKICRDLALA